MRVWLYGRLSNDDDVEMNSLENQLQIIRDYAREHGYTVVGESYDDNSSGMRFDRQGVERLTAAVENNLIDAVIVKDMSRLGRHRTQTLCISTFCGIGAWPFYLPPKASAPWMTRTILPSASPN